MKIVSSAFLSGVLFGIGLVVSGMTDANKVLAFLTLNSDWNPALALVMGGAISVHLLFYQLVKRRTSPFFTETFQIPTRKDISGQLVVGSLLFGLGWGLGGVCPGPGFVSLVSGSSEIFMFVGSMLIGMVIWQNTAKRMKL